jgi:heme-degrading monooxygenase HmoA/uncharacterized protein YciI
MHYLLFYEVADDYLARRAPFRDEHLGKAWEASERGELVLGGAFAAPADGAVLLFRGDSPEVAERFARTDPYVTSGAVKRWYVREWTTVVGSEAATPIKPTESRAPSLAAAAHVSPILRMWRAQAAPEKAGDYFRHVTERVFPALRRIEGHRGAHLLRRNLAGAVEFVVLTLWDSMNAVKRFAGQEPEHAVVEPEAEAALISFDKLVTHFQVVYSTDEQR